MAHKLDRDPNDSLNLMRSLPAAVLVAILAIAPAVIVAHVSIVPAILIGVGLGVLTFHLIHRITNAGGYTLSSLYAPGGSSTPPPPQYSLAESLLARGKYAEAAEAFELLSEDLPDDPEPPLRLARLQRDKLADYAQAALWFKKALAVKALKPATTIAISRELIELYSHKLNTPSAALPYLAKLSADHPGTPAAEWARREYLQIKDEMALERDSE